MQIFVLEKRRKAGICRDENMGFVIVARHGKQARQLAADKETNDDDKDEWLNAKKSNLTRLGVYTGGNKKPYIVLTDFFNG